jgi:protein-S-isoprenylcysteine O-methyltransferase Ste14
MPDEVVGIAISLCWGTVILVWIAGGLRNAWPGGRRRIRDRSGTRAYVLATLACAAVVSLGYGLIHSLSFDGELTRYLGLAVLVPATAFTIWARYALGTMWSVAPEVGGDQRLRTGGPYGITRHPIYTGSLGMLVGTTLLAGGHELIALVVVGVILFGVKIHQEERLMLATFPDEYPAYRRRVPQLVPWLRLPGGQ